MSETVRMPDFIIAGAMKCATSSLHHILASHPRIFIPPREIHFYHLDDPTQHPDFLFYEGSEWRYPRFDENRDEYLAWYTAFFEEAGDDQVVGEDSTTYIASRRAIDRIARLNPSARIIVMLRDPPSRTYSHYWHLVRTGRALWDFEESLQMAPEAMIQRSLYRIQVEHLFSRIPRHRVHFVLFEEFVADTEGEVEKVLDFLEVEGDGFAINDDRSHRNAARVPRSLRIQLYRNRILRGRAKRIYRAHVPWAPPPDTNPEALWVRILDRIHRTVNPLGVGRPPPMKPETRRFLNGYLSTENDGLGELIGKDVGEYWYREP